MLKIIADTDQVIHPEWIQYYDELPTNSYHYEGTITGVDLAISEAERADCTAMVTAHIFGDHETLKVYILPNPYNERVDFPTIVDKIEEMSQATYYGTHNVRVYVEDVAFQKSAIQMVHKKGNWKVEGFKVGGKDKRYRLNSVASLIKSGKVLFPRHGCEDLINQIVYFGVEKHDDLMDAFVMDLLMVMDKEMHYATVLNAADFGL